MKIEYLCLVLFVLVSLCLPSGVAAADTSGAPVVTHPTQPSHPGHGNPQGNSNPQNPAKNPKNSNQGGSGGTVEVSLTLMTAGFLTGLYLTQRP